MCNYERDDQINVLGGLFWLLLEDLRLGNNTEAFRILLRSSL